MPVNRRRDTGKWGYRHYCRGKNYRRHVWDTRDEAVQAYQEFLDRLGRELPIIDSNISLVEAVNKFLDYSARVDKSEWRLKALYTNFRTFIIPFFSEGRRLKDISYLDLEGFIDIQLKRAVTRNTIRHYVIDLNALLNWAVKEEIIDVNPMKKVNRRRITPEKIIKKGHTPEEIRACEGVLDEEELFFFKFLKFTGARLTEALTMRWDDVNYKEKEIILRGTKTEESFRKIDMSEGLFETLNGLEKYKGMSAFVFHHPDGKRILRKDKLFRKLYKRTGIKITAKDLRDYFCSMIGMGDNEYTPDIVTASKLMGHTNLNTTQKYLFSLKDRRRKAVEVLDRIEGISTDISTGRGTEDGDKGAKPCKNWWRCRESNPGHCGYEPHALTV
jgi:integrase